MNNIGLYIHIPFCTEKCYYCDFYSLPRMLDRADVYTDKLRGQLKELSAFCRDRVCDSIYIGGGTPGAIDPALICSIVDTAADCYRLSPDCEITVECNPASAKEEAYAAYRKAGIGRISFGVQSYSDETLKRIGRKHTFGDALRSLDEAASAGIENLSCDLMYALPGQKEDEIFRAFDELLSHGMRHLSLYGLKVEENTVFGRMKDLPLPSEEEEEKIYLFACEHFGRHGFSQYEISNFAIPGYESRHNLKYWKREEYLGFGPAAHSFFNGVRFCADRDLEKYLSSKDFSPGSEYYSGKECISVKAAEEEELMLSLRLTEGYPVNKLLRAAADKDLCRAYASRLAADGFAVIRNGSLSLTPKGMFVSNTVISDLLSMMKE